MVMFMHTIFISMSISSPKLDGLLRGLILFDFMEYYRVQYQSYDYVTIIAPV